MSFKPHVASALEWLDNPIRFVTEVLGVTPEPWQADVLAAIPDNRRMAIRSGHGVGKSALLSWLILWFHSVHFPAKTGATAPTEHQLMETLWPELAMWHRRMTPVWRDRFEWQAESFFVKEAPEESFATARVSRKEKPEAFAGLHSENILLLGDEASGIEEPIYEAAVGSLSTPGARMVLTGNPTRPNGYFYDCFHKMRAGWWTKRVSSEEVERARGHIQEVIDRYGKDSNAYRVRVLGEFPTAADEQVIPLELVEAAIARDVEASDRYRVVWGLDVARFGDDRTALAKRRGNVLLEPIQFWRHADTMQTAGQVMAAYQECEYGERPSEILVDVIGIGAGVVDRMRELGLPVRGVNVGESPASGERFMRRRDELWWQAREWFGRRDCSIPDDPALVAELTAPIYTFSSSGKLIVEPKSDLKKRGLPSPDLADAFILTLAGGLDIAELHEGEKMDRYLRAAKAKRRERSWRVA